MKLYISGTDIEYDADGSVKLIDRFSEEDDPEAYAMHIASRVYELGLKVEKSPKKAERWLKMARDKCKDPDDEI